MEKSKPRGHVVGSDASGRLFDTLRMKHGFTNDRQLGDWFGLHRSSVSRVRHGKGPVSNAMRLAIMAKDGLTVSEIDKLIKKPRFDVKPVAQEGAQ